MPAQLLNGKQISEQQIQAIRSRVDTRLAAGKRAPALAVVLIGDDPASAVYVRNKKLACERAGIRSVSFEHPADFSESALIALVQRLNEDPEIDGILVQLPLPDHIDADKIIETINPHKDVDGFHPYNFGRLALKMPLLRPCTPFGAMTLLKHTGIDPAGLDAVVIGASNIVGRPMALELLMARATVTVCHSKTKQLADKVRGADIVIAGVGRPRFVQGDWIKPGAIVIDIGVNRLPDGKLCGDVDFDAAREVAGWITPVPGGAGPMTISTLMHNTLEAHIALHP